MNSLGIVLIVASAVVLLVLIAAVLAAVRSIRSREDETAQKLSSVEAGFSARLEALDATLRGLDQRLSSGLASGQEAGARQTEIVGKVLTDNRTELDRRLAENQKLLGALTEKIGNIDQANKSLADSIRQIDEVRRLLVRPGGRGPFGEAVLIETALDVLPPRFVITQHMFNDRSRVDLAIRVGERLVPIDSKFPLEDFRTLQNAATDEERQKARTILLRQVKKHIDAVSKYIKVDEGTYPFALMYIPSEAVFLEITSDEETAKYARSMKVVPVGPGAFLAYIEVILEGLRGFEVEKRTEQILEDIHGVAKLLQNLKDNHGKMMGHLTNASKASRDVERSIQELDGAVERIHSAESRDEKEPKV